MHGVIADDGDSNGGDVPEIMIRDFGGGNLKVATRFVEQAANDVPLIFEGIAAIETEMDFERSDGHVGMVIL
jgi:hypothetical protein